MQVNHNRFLSYTKDAEGNLAIVPEEAEIIPRIYREYLEGASLLQIGQGLKADGIKTAAGSDYWLQSTLKKILTNEKYIGDALLQKTYTVDFLNKKRVANNGIVPQYYVENNHPTIIPSEKFMKVREEMYRRAHMECGPDQNAGFTAADTLFRASCTAPTATTSSAESTGTTMGASPPFGDVSAEWKKTAHPVRQEP